MKVAVIIDKVEEIVVAKVEDDYLGGYLEASGDDQEEALWNLQEVVIKRIEELASIDFEGVVVREV